MASVKTLNKLNAAILAVQSIVFGVAMALNDSEWWGIAGAMIFYVVTIMATVSSEHIVNVGEARLKELA